MSLGVGALAVGLWTLGWAAIVLAWRPARVVQPASEASRRYTPL
jgi:hypothetical protein